MKVSSNSLNRIEFVNKIPTIVHCTLFCYLSGESLFRSRVILKYLHHQSKYSLTSLCYETSSMPFFMQFFRWLSVWTSVAWRLTTRRALCAARARILKVGEPLVKSNKFLLVLLLVKTLVSLFIFFLSLFNNGLDKIVPMGYQNQINKLPETSFGRTRSLGDMIN